MAILRRRFHDVGWGGWQIDVRGKAVNATTRRLSSIDLVRRVTQAACAYTVARLRILESIPGNPMGVAITSIEGVTALMARHLPSAPSFNSVVGLRPGQAHLIAPLVDWYQDHGVAGRFEIAAGDDDPVLARALSRLGFVPEICHAAMVGEPTIEDAEAACVERVTSPEQMEEFLTAYVLGWGVPPARHEPFKQNVRPWLGQPGWTLYLARVEGRASAAAILFVRAGVGYFADVATDPAYRKRGLHAALLARRAWDARAAGADIICGGADFLSGSQRNMERIGMRLLFLRSIWIAGR